tara:strand:+ start:113 stop:802 length:690 start_codon:yes stop_codon:yes gene_type:complete
MPCDKHGEKCNGDYIDPNVDNGMMTKIWGPAGWLFLHCITFGYPYVINPENSDHDLKQDDYYKFFYYLGKVLPCKYCRDSYMEFFKELPIVNSLNSREELTKWLYDMHNKVNHKLGVPKCQIPSFKEVKTEYERYRAKCKKTTEKERDVNQAKGCFRPADGTTKRCVVKIVNCQNGDVTRRNNDNSDDVSKLKLPSSGDYLVILKSDLYNYLIVLILIVLIMLKLFKLI